MMMISQVWEPVSETQGGCKPFVALSKLAENASFQEVEPYEYTAVSRQKLCVNEEKYPLPTHVHIREQSNS